jgi:hypothetical protein
MTNPKALLPEWQPPANVARAVNTPVSGFNAGRRDFFKLAGTGLSGFFLSPLLNGHALATTSATVNGNVTPDLRNTARNCIFIHLVGAPSQIDTFDLKVGPWTPGDFNPTTYNGTLFPQGLMPELAQQLSTRLAVVRGLRSPALVHSLQQIWVQIARSPSSAFGKIAPNIGSVAALEFEKQRKPSDKLPSFVSLNTGGSIVGAGYLDGLYTPFDVQPTAAGISTLRHTDGQNAFEARYRALQLLDTRLRKQSPLGAEANAMGSFYERGKVMMYDDAVEAAFRFTEDEHLRYGDSAFGHACVVARNLLKANLGTRFLQINFGNWDHHQEIYAKGANGNELPGLYTMCGGLDKGLARLLDDLAAAPGTRGGTLLDETLIVAMGEFGRTVGALTNIDGRDHYYQHFALFAGGGVKGGRIIGETTPDGANVKDPGWSQNRAVANEDIAATIYSALGIDYTTTRTDDPFGRGFEYVPFASQGAWYPITEVFEKAVTPAPRTEITPRSPETSPRSRGRSSDRRTGS